MPDIIMKRERTDRWTKMRLSRARSSGPAASSHMPSSVDCITTTPESELLVHTACTSASFHRDAVRGQDRRPAAIWSPASAGSWRGCTQAHEAKQRVITGAGVMAVPHAILLLAMGRAHARIHVEHDAAGRSAAMHKVDPLAGQVGKSRKVLVCSKPL